MVRSNKDTINMLMNIDNYFGEHKGRLAPVIMFMLASAAPFMFYMIFLPWLLPFKFAVAFELLWTARMAMVILGREKERLVQYEAQSNDEYVSADELVRVAHVHEDGLIEYTNGRVAYILSGMTMTYLNDNDFSIAMENFLRKLDSYEYDIDCQLVTDEFKLQNSLEKLKVYQDKELMKERMMFYIDQDEFCKSKSKLYRFVFLIKTSKYDWKTLRAYLENILRAEASKVFFTAQICGSDEVSDIISRDLCTNIDLNKMLVNKYKNDGYYGSKVLFYGDDIPEEFKPKKEDIGISNRRVIMKNDEEEEN